MNFFCSSLCKDLSDNLTEKPIVKNSIAYNLIAICKLRLTGVSILIIELPAKNCPMIFLHRAGDNVRLTPFHPYHLVSEPVGNFYSYDGSLTTPPCYESVKWRVLQSISSISERQVNESMNFYTLDIY